MLQPRSAYENDGVIICQVEVARLKSIIGRTAQHLYSLIYIKEQNVIVDQQ